MSILTSPSVTVCHHPLISHNLSILRNKDTSCESFRAAMTRVGRIVIQAATEDLPLVSTRVETPVCPAEVQILAPDLPVIVAPILRAGLMLSEVAVDLIPGAQVYHIGLYRNEETLKPITYYNKLPLHLNYGDAQVLLMDPMLATGGSAVAAVEMMHQLGVSIDRLRYICIIAAPEGIGHLSDLHPGIRIFTAAVDERLNEKGYIVPGLGDAGDRTFGTL